MKNNPLFFVDPTGLIHQAWNEPPFDGRLHDDPGAGLEVLCTKGRNLANDMEWLHHSLEVRWAEIVRLGKDADAGHIDRHAAELATLKRCEDECEKNRKPEPGEEWDKITEWLKDRWREFDNFMSTPHCWWCVAPLPGSKVAPQR